MFGSFVKFLCHKCAITSSLLAHEFSELAEEKMFSGPDGELCHVEEEEGEGSGHHPSETPGGHCEASYHFMRQLLVRLNLTSPCCLGVEGDCQKEPILPRTSRRTPPAQAYGYGFLMVVLVSVASLTGLLMLPVARNPRLKQYYQYVYALLISLGASALFCDAILHLIPEAFGLHGHSEDEGVVSDSHAHMDEEKDFTVVWRSCLVILGMYTFFLVEFILHSWTSHSHSISNSHSDASIAELEEVKMDATTTFNKGSQSEEGTEADTTGGGKKGLPKSRGDLEGGMTADPTFPHATCSAGENGLKSPIIHPIKETCNREGCKDTDGSTYGRRCGRYLCNIKPLAWLIVIGDGLHNFADGMALGAAIAQSLSLGISTMIALLFHEIPHEIGDYFVLLSTGMTWYAALGFNFVSALTAVVGFFVGVAIGTSSAEANNWILAAAAGIFLYIALVDLLPELVHSKEKGRRRGVMFLMINIGFITSFIALLLLAVYEEELNALVEV